MKESYGEGLASHSGLESCAEGGNVLGEALTEAHVGRVFSSEITSSTCRPCGLVGKATRKSSVNRELLFRRRGVAEERACVETPCARTGRPTELPRRMSAGDGRGRQRRSPTCTFRGSRMSPEYLRKRATKVGAPMAESVEERETPKGNAGSTLLVPDTGPGTCEASEEPAYGR